MVWENGLLYLILGLFASSLVVLVLGRARLGRFLLVASSIAGITGFLSFVYQFLSNDFGMTVVFQNSSRALPIPFKVVAALEGAGGSLLLWLGMMSTALLVYEVASRQPSRTTGLIVSLFALYVSIALVFINPFAQVGGAFSNGLGLTPSLQSYWALVHPPTVFSAYTAMAFLFASVVSQKWQNRSGPDASGADGRLFTVTWVLLGLGLLFGGIWAYQTEGWGGYWAWDPIETSALIPWLILTAILISSRTGSGLRRDYLFFGATFSASALFFTSYVARGSAAPSVHSYGDLVSGAPFITLSLLPVVIAAATVLGNRSSAGTALASGAMKSPRYLEFWCITLLATANLALLLTEAISPDFGVTFVPSTLTHDLVSFPFVIALCLLLSAEYLLPLAKKERAVSSTVAVLAGVLAFLFAAVNSSNVIFDVVLPFSAALLAAGLLALARAAMGRSHFASPATFRYIAMIGLSVLLVGVLFSSAMRTSNEASVGVGQTVGAGGVSVTVAKITTAPVDRTVYLPGYGAVSESIDTSVGYFLSGQTSGDHVAVLRYFPSIDAFVPTPSIQGLAGGDTYVVLAQTSSVVQATSAAFLNGTVSEPAQVAVTIREIPDVSLVWLGASVFLLANLPFILLKPRDDIPVAVVSSWV